MADDTKTDLTASAPPEELQEVLDELQQLQRSFESRMGDLERKQKEPVPTGGAGFF